MDCVLSNWVKGYMPDVRDMFQSLMSLSVPSPLQLSPLQPSPLQPSQSFISIEYMTGIQYKIIPFVGSITICDIKRLIDVPCKLFYQKTRLNNGHEFTSSTTVTIIPILKLVKMSNSMYPIQYIIEYISNDPQSNFHVYLYDIVDPATMKHLVSLQNIHKLTINRYNRYNMYDHVFDDPECDVSGFGHIHTVSILYCDNIVNIGALSDVNTLILSSCHNINNDDISELGNVHNLTLQWCPNITDIHGLENVNLTIENCKHLDSTT
jgi:hypothetical protein